MHGMLRVTRPRVQSLAALVRALVSFRRRKTSSCAFVPDRSRHALTHASKQIVRPQRKSESENGDAEQRWEARAGGCERASEQWTRGGDWERRRRRGDGTEHKEAARPSDGTGAPLSEEAIGTHCTAGTIALHALMRQAGYTMATQALCAPGPTGSRALMLNLATSGAANSRMKSFADERSPSSIPTTSASRRSDLRSERRASASRAVAAAEVRVPSGGAMVPTVRRPHRIATTQRNGMRARAGGRAAFRRTLALWYEARTLSTAAGRVPTPDPVATCLRRSGRALAGACMLAGA